MNGSVPAPCRADYLKGWVSLSRPPFHTVGILPFCLGSLLAWKLRGLFDATVFSLGTLGVILVMLSTYHAGEYFDLEEDRISKGIFKSRFAGGSGVIPAGLLPRHIPFWTSLIALAAAGMVGLILQFHFHTGPYTVLLGALGAIPGFFYSTRPVRLVERGVGEICIGFCFGWLPVASAFYIQTATVDPVIHWISIPIGLTIFNVILLNEFHDYEADQAVNKRNLLVRIGIPAGVALYLVLSVLAWLSMAWSVRMGVPGKALYGMIPVMALSAVISAMVLARQYEKRRLLEVLCGLNIAVNLCTTAAYIWAYL